ncbi:MAG: TetR/AcrR family transcriptional regulator, partial [Chloroflexus aggregans]
ADPEATAVLVVRIFRQGLQPPLERSNS